MQYRGSLTKHDLALMMRVFETEGTHGFFDLFSLDDRGFGSLVNAVLRVGILDVVKRFREWFPFEPETFELVEKYRSVPAILELALVRALARGAGGVEFTAWLARASRAERMVCEIHDDVRHRGTGFLIAKNLVLTSRHVVEDIDPGKITLAFDAVTFLGCNLDKGVDAKLGSTTLEKANKALEPLDVIVLTTDSEIGEMRLGAKQERRGWLHLPDLAASENDLVALVHRPTLENYYVTPGAFLKTEEQGETFLYDADSDSGSSGAPVVDLLTWEVLGVHDSAPEDLPPHRRATTGGAIRKLIESAESITLPDPPSPFVDRLSAIRALSRSDE